MGGGSGGWGKENGKKRIGRWWKGVLNVGCELI
jgi:hypothetical protein